MAAVKYALRNKTRLGALLVRDKTLVLQGMLWADEIRDVDFKGVNSRATIGEKELELSAALVEQYSSDFTPEGFSDDYQIELRRLIDAKFESGDTIDTDATFGDTSSDDTDSSDKDGADDADVVDLMEALKASLGRKEQKAASSTAKKAAEKTASKTAKKSGGKSAKKATKKAPEKSA